MLVQGGSAPSVPAALGADLAGVGVEGGREGGRVVELDVPSACAGTGCTVFSRVSAHLRISATPFF